MNKTIIFDSIAGGLGVVLAFMFGELTGLFWALICFMAIDYITGVTVAAVNKTVSSKAGFKGLAKKLIILLFVSVAHIADTYIMNGTPAAMSATMMFYIANEGISIIENASALGLPVPARIKKILLQLTDEEKVDNDKKGS